MLSNELKIIKEINDVKASSSWVNGMNSCERSSAMCTSRAAFFTLFALLPFILSSRPSRISWNAFFMKMYNLSSRRRSTLEKSSKSSASARQHVSDKSGDVVMNCASFITASCSILILHALALSSYGDSSWNGGMCSAKTAFSLSR